MINDPAQHYFVVLLYFVRIPFGCVEAFCAPVNCMRFREPPVQRTPFFVHLFRKDGVTPSSPDRPLSYFIAHEVTHGLISRFLGLAYWRIPVWKNEGYADYVGKGGDFDFQKNLALFKKGDPALDPRASGLYLRYHLLVAELLDRRKLSVEEMLRENFDREQLEADLRSEKE